TVSRRGRRRLRLLSFIIEIAAPASGKRRIARRATRAGVHIAASKPQVALFSRIADSKRLSLQGQIHVLPYHPTALVNIAVVPPEGFHAPSPSPCRCSAGLRRAVVRPGGVGCHAR